MHPALDPVLESSLQGELSFMSTWSEMNGWLVGQLARSTAFQTISVFRQLRLPWNCNPAFSITRREAEFSDTDTDDPVQIQNLAGVVDASKCAFGCKAVTHQAWCSIHPIRPRRCTALASRGVDPVPVFRSRSRETRRARPTGQGDSVGRIGRRRVDPDEDLRGLRLRQTSWSLISSGEPYSSWTIAFIVVARVVANR